MSSNNSTPQVAAFSVKPNPNESERDLISQNVESILEFYTREEEKIGHSQRAVEGIGGFVGRPFFLASILLFVGLWILADGFSSDFWTVQFDEPPFFWLQGIVSLCALLTTIVVLIKQNRMGKLQEQRAHLDLQLNLLTEQKATKLIHLLEELRRDLPMVQDRHDPEATALQQHTDPQHVLATIDELIMSQESAKQAAKKSDKEP